MRKAFSPWAAKMSPTRSRASRWRVLAIRLADSVNGVSRLHGDVSRKMWHNLWPQVPADEVPIKHVTNGIHVRSWLAPDIALHARPLSRQQVDERPSRSIGVGRRHTDSR